MESNNWFECKVSTEKEIGEGKIKKFSESYLVDAVTFTDAEARIIKEVSPFCNGQFDVTDIKRAKYGELFMSDDANDDKWFKVKINIITVDDKGNEKKSPFLSLVQAKTLEGALEHFKRGMQGTMADYQIALIQETNLLDVYPFQVEEPISEEEAFAVGNAEQDEDGAPDTEDEVHGTEDEVHGTEDSASETEDKGLADNQTPYLQAES